MTPSAVEDALRAWVKSASSYSDENVFFGQQKVERPAGPYITVQLDGPIPLGAFDAVTEHEATDPDPGEEIELRVTGEREVTVRVQVFNAATTGSGSAVTVMTAVQLGISLPSVRDALDEAGVSPFDVGSIQNLGALLGTAFDGRAALDVRCYFRTTVSEFTTYIERVEGTLFGEPYSFEVT